MELTSDSLSGFVSRVGPVWVSGVGVSDSSVYTSGIRHFKTSLNPTKQFAPSIDCTRGFASSCGLVWTETTIVVSFCQFGICGLGIPDLSLESRR